VSLAVREVLAAFAIVVVAGVFRVDPGQTHVDGFGIIVLATACLCRAIDGGVLALPKYDSKTIPRMEERKDSVTRFRENSMPLHYSVLIIALFGMCVGCASTNQVPQTILDIESTAEDVYDEALLNNVAVVKADAAKMKAAWAGFRARAIKDGASEQHATALDKAIAKLMTAAGVNPGPAALARAANGVSAPMDELFALYHPKVPAAVLALDYLGREIALDGMDANFTSATSHVNDLETVWKRLRQSTVNAGGSSQATQFDASIAAERSAIARANGTELTNQANSAHRHPCSPSLARFGTLPSPQQQIPTWHRKDIQQCRAHQSP